MEAGNEQGAHVDYAEQFAAYSFTSDETYQQGFAGIITSGVLDGKSDEEKAEIALRSEVFYFNRIVGSSLSIEDALRARQEHSAQHHRHGEPVITATETTLAENPQQEPQMLSFAQLKALIEEGRTDEIPNNKIIPNVLSSEAPSESRASPPKKPWEAVVAS
ncbi:hypothetical protein C2E23DRAFT_742727 [Lenzites betulinus]|nr:hypothetical protein C2E23DRAFT_742727 [Lenzites betulinus]